MKKMLIFVSLMAFLSFNLHCGDGHGYGGGGGGNKEHGGVIDLDSDPTAESRMSDLVTEMIKVLDSVTAKAVIKLVVDEMYTHPRRSRKPFYHLEDIMVVVNTLLVRYGLTELVLEQEGSLGDLLGVTAPKDRRTLFSGVVDTVDIRATFGIIKVDVEGVFSLDEFVERAHEAGLPAGTDEFKVKGESLKEPFKGRVLKSEADYKHLIAHGLVDNNNNFYLTPNNEFEEDSRRLFGPYGGRVRMKIGRKTVYPDLQNVFTFKDLKKLVIDNDFKGDPIGFRVSGDHVKDSFMKVLRSEDEVRDLVENGLEGGDFMLEPVSARPAG